MILLPNIVLVARMELCMDINLAASVSLPYPFNLAPLMILVLGKGLKHAALLQSPHTHITAESLDDAVLPGMPRTSSQEVFEKNLALFCAVLVEGCGGSDEGGVRSVSFRTVVVVWALDLLVEDDEGGGGERERVEREWVEGDEESEDEDFEEEVVDVGDELIRSEI